MENALPAREMARAHTTHTRTRTHTHTYTYIHTSLFFAGAFRELTAHHCCGNPPPLQKAASCVMGVPEGQVVLVPLGPALFGPEYFQEKANAVLN